MLKFQKILVNSSIRPEVLIKELKVSALFVVDRHGARKKGGEGEREIVY